MSMTMNFLLAAGSGGPLGSWFHTLDAVALQLGPVAIRWYGLSYLAGFVAGYFLMVRLAKAGLTALPAHRVADALLLLVLGVLVGGRLGYALVYDRALLTSFSPSFPFWELLAINKGGMASHGGILGVAIAAWLISRGFKREDGTREGQSSFLATTDVMALCGAIGIFFGRMANFVNGELLGAIVSPPGQPGPWWAVKYPQELLSGHAPKLSPAQQQALDVLVNSASKPGENYDQALTHVVTHASTYKAQLEPLISARHASQLYQAAGEGLFVCALVWIIARRPRVAGVISAWWLIAYGIMRVVTEFYRLPDTQFAVQRPYGLSRGQWLSVAMIALGAVVLAYAIKRGGVKHLGWGTRKQA